MASPSHGPSITVAAGIERVTKEGVVPFLDRIKKGVENLENGQFFKAKQFADLYDVVFRMCTQPGQ